MRATFFGFESVRKALMASQKGIDVTSHNVSNVNTDGYARQRIDVSSISPESGPTRYARTKGSSVGGGVEVTGVSQIRDQFLDLRFRKEASEFGKWDATFAVLLDVENIFDELTTNGLNTRLNDFYAQLESFSLNAESIEFASIFRSSAEKVTEILNQYAAGLNDLEEQYIYNTNVEVNEVNTIVEKIGILNNQIKSEILQGSDANELNDTRNLLLDKLAGYIGTNYEYTNDGQVSLKLGDVYLLDASKHNVTEKLIFDSSENPIEVRFADNKKAEISSGSIGGQLASINGNGGLSNENNPIGIQYFKQSINLFAKAFAESFNSINDASGNNKLFVAGDGSDNITAGNIKISEEWMSDAQFITRSLSDDGEGRNDNLLRMLEGMETKMDISPVFKGTFEEFALSLISDVAVETGFSEDMKDTSSYILNVLIDQRESVMGVSIEEETINMEKYQKSFNAAARLMTILDEMLDILINRMGVVGR